jgi:ABC-type Mn2+/Zn2+ transport system permease subunit
VVLAAIVGADLYLGGGLFGLVLVLAVVGLSRARGQDLTAAVGIALSAGFALGVVLLSARSGFSKDLTAYTVGDVLAVSDRDLAATALVGLVVTAVLVALRKELVFAAFDPAGFTAAGYPAAILDVLLLVLVEAAVVTAVPAVGTVLAVALLVGPAAAARLWTDRLALLIPVAVLVGTGSALAGVLLSTRVDVAAGGAIALISGTVLGLSFLVAPGGLLGHVRNRPSLARETGQP